MWRITTNELPPTLNQFWSGGHWGKRKGIRDKWHLILLNALREAKVPNPLPKRDKVYQIHCTQFCESRVRDSDNAVIGTKLLKDTLKHYGYVEDDDAKIFNDGILSTRKGKKNKMIIHIL